MNTILDKLEIKAKLELVTGMHIGTSGNFSPIGAVDNVVVRDPVTKIPIIPGSSLKGKLRTLLARIESDDHILNTIDKDHPVIKRLFGYNGDKAGEKIINARLQFCDLFMNEDCIKELESKDTDLYLTEIKFENTIDRITSVANPRQMERVPAGAEFDLKIIYNAEYTDTDTLREFRAELKEVEDKQKRKEKFEELRKMVVDDAKSEILEDFKTLAKGFKILQLDYIGGSGSRGYGRVKLNNFEVKAHGVGNFKIPDDFTNKLNQILGGN